MLYYDYLCIYTCLPYWSGSKPKTEYIYLPLNSQVVLVIKNLPANVGYARALDSITGLGRSPGVENGDRVQYSCLENSMDKGAWQAIIHRIANSQMQLKQLNTAPSTVLGGDETEINNTLHFHPQSSLFSVGDRQVN